MAGWTLQWEKGKESKAVEGEKRKESITKLIEERAGRSEMTVDKNPKMLRDWKSEKDQITVHERLGEAREADG